MLLLNPVAMKSISSKGVVFIYIRHIGKRRGILPLIELF